MPRPPRLEYPDAVYHATSRRMEQAALFLDDRDRQSMLAILDRVLRAGQARAFAFCLMGNHYHLVLQTQQPNLSTLMRRINSLYSLTFNQRHRRHGHVFEGRFHAVHVDRDAYLLEVCRYVDLNPVRAGVVELPSQWRWSSYRAHVGEASTPGWLATSELHGILMREAAHDDAQIIAAQRGYARWVDDGRTVRLWRNSLRCGAYLGDDDFVARMQAKLA